MKHTIIYLGAIIIILTSCTNDQKEEKNIKLVMTDSVNFKSNYSDVNGIRMYYEIYGQGAPLVLIHGGGSTIQSSFEKIIPGLAKNYKVIPVELQNHGRSGFRDTPETFEQDADDVAALLTNLGITKASFFGFSNGGTTAMQIAIRHPAIVDKLVLAAAAYKRDGFLPGFFDGMQHATLINMPQALKDAFLKVNPDSNKLRIMFEKDRDRMIGFKDLTDDQVRSINSSALIIIGDADVITPEHAVEMYRLIPNCELAVIPGGHGKYIGEITTLSSDTKDIDFVIAITKEFLDKPVPKH
ncbi:MAG TPA: alpha/beta hydrolase [Chitinophagaceae bacterium]|nr:alpha/beta hydrolase [Chitinophagaceae bacterium]